MPHYTTICDELNALCNFEVLICVGKVSGQSYSIIADCESPKCSCYVEDSKKSHNAVKALDRYAISGP